MTRLTYLSGQEIRAGDKIRLHGEPGHVEFIACVPTGDPARDWFLEHAPGGGVMLVVGAFGSVFIAIGELDERLEFVSRSTP